MTVYQRLRLLLWLVLLLPIVAASLWALRAIDRHHDARIAAELTDALRLEATRVLDTLARQAVDAEALAADPSLRTALAAPLVPDGIPRSASPTDALSRTDARSDPPIDASATGLNERLLETAARQRTDIVAVQAFDLRSRPIDDAGDASDDPRTRALLGTAIAERRVAFGQAHTATHTAASAASSIAEPLLELAVPVVSPDGRLIGALLLHSRLGSVVEPLTGHHVLGDSTEVYLVQHPAGEPPRALSALRFGSPITAARGVPELLPITTGPITTGQPADRTTEPPLRATDYRGVHVMMAVQSLPGLDWSLVAKVDAAEALAPLTDLRRTALATIAAGVLTLFGIWLFVLMPLGRRMRHTAQAAERVVHGQRETPINDEHADRIGEVARSIDRLTLDLDSDRRQRALAEARLRHQSMHDDLTGLVNRRQAHAMIDTLSETPAQRASLVFLDIDDFKAINDLHGHAVGDEVLVALARRLESAIAVNATLARWGGDQFLVILPDTLNQEAHAVAARVRALFDDPVGTSAGRHRLDCSIGVVTSGLQRPLSDVLGDAEAAASNEKRRQHTAGSVDAFAVRAVRSALEERRVELWLQPIVQVPTPGRARPVGAEALVRLRSRDGGIIPPADFLSAVHASPLGRTLDGYVMERCTETLARWRRAGVVDDSFRLSLNITGASLHEPDLAADLEQRLTVQGVPAANLIIEISEKTGDVDEQLLVNLRRLGVGIALDDVGLEHSNIDRLVALSPDIAKLDRQWLDDPVVLPRLVDLCRELGMQLIAEGVETHAQLARLQALSVSSFQGYLFDRPRPAVQFVERWGKLSGTSRPTGMERAPDHTLSVVG